MKAFWHFLLRKNLPSNSLSNLGFGVFGLGDSSYPKYNFVAKRLFRRLEGLGAKPFIERGEGDDQHSLGFEGGLEPWLSSLWSTLLKISPLPPGKDILPPEKPSPIYSIKTSPPDPERCLPTLPYLSQEKIGKEKRSFNQTNPYYAKVIANERISDPSSERDVRNVVFDIGDSGIQYSPGDVVWLLPRNPKRATEDFIRSMGWDPFSIIEELRLQPTDQDDSQSQQPGTSVGGGLVFPCRLLDLLLFGFDIFGTPNRFFFECLSFFTTSELERERLLYFTSPSGQGDLRSYNQKEKRTYGEVLDDFPSGRDGLRASLAAFLSLVPRQRARPFSISSSQKLAPDQLHVTFLIVSFRTPLNRHRRGLLSNYVANLSPSSPEKIGLWVSPGALRFPEILSTPPLILIGPGTGIAMFRSYLQERSCGFRGDLPRCFLFFGCRRRDEDYLYKEELAKYVERGVLSQLFVAFSREQLQKIYVQDHLKLAAKMVWPLIRDDGAIIIVSGSAQKMPYDVRKAFKEMASSEGGLSLEESERFVTSLEISNRYISETWA
eukprot:TRINITY_DN1955_c0_g1_i3.p1 TRINITY_DN1955_c0_g1~~TRINITY_DN1955_c0_g1_i3.p1  ORF type:complete len:618 (-),score=136.84 TRINITY_DN1955_c0_g1_i3:70-1716(-)